LLYHHHHHGIGILMPQEMEGDEDIVQRVAKDERVHAYREGGQGWHRAQCGYDTISLFGEAAGNWIWLEQDEVGGHKTRLEKLAGAST
jgi:hypothetical protein